MSFETFIFNYMWSITFSDNQDIVWNNNYNVIVVNSALWIITWVHLYRNLYNFFLKTMSQFLKYKYLRSLNTNNCCCAIINFKQEWNNILLIKSLCQQYNKFAVKLNKLSLLISCYFLFIGTIHVRFPLSEFSKN